MEIQVFQCWHSCLSCILVLTPLLASFFLCWFFCCIFVLLFVVCSLLFFSVARCLKLDSKYGVRRGARELIPGNGHYPHKIIDMYVSRAHCLCMRESNWKKNWKKIAILVWVFWTMPRTIKDASKLGSCTSLQKYQGFSEKAYELMHFPQAGYVTLNVIITDQIMGWNLQSCSEPK